MTASTSTVPGAKANTPSAAQPLPVGHRMGELEITGVLGIGGFGIVYRAWDHALQRVVAIKEYMPSMLAVRHGNLTVSLRGERFAATFNAGQAGFINEARLLAQFDHPGLIKVLRFWEDHGTAYMATPFYEGQTLKQRLAGGKALPEAEILRLMAALLGALETLHRAQCFHRDIALDNILIQPDGRPVLLDFGAARKLIGDMVDDSTVMLKPGYAPIEQYTDDPAFRQGPWTDVYALGAVIHILVCGELPPAAVVRSIQDTYQPLLGRVISYSPRLLQAADQALSLRIEDRPQSVAAFAALLGLQSPTPGQYTVPEPQRAVAPVLETAAVAEANPAVASNKTAVEPGPVVVAALAGAAAEPAAAAETAMAFDLDSIVASSGADDGADEILTESPAAPAPVATRRRVRPAVASQPAPQAIAPPPAAAPPTTTRKQPRWLWPVVAMVGVVVIGALTWPHAEPVEPVALAATPQPTPQATPQPTPEATAAPAAVATAASAASDVTAEVASATASAVASTRVSVGDLNSEVNTALPGAKAAADPSAQSWKLARKYHSAAAYQAFLQQNPGSLHDAEARHLLAKANEREVAAATAATAATVAATVPVQLRLQPWGEVYIGGVRRGISPPLKALALAPGNYDVEVRNGNLPPYRTHLQIAPGAQSAEIAHSFE